MSQLEEICHCPTTRSGEATSCQELTVVDTALGPRVLEKRCGGKGDRADSIFVGDRSNLRTFSGQSHRDAAFILIGDHSNLRTFK